MPNTVEDLQTLQYQQLSGASSPIASSRLKMVRVTPVIDTNAYTAKDQLGDIMSITGAAAITGGGGLVRGVTLLDKTQAQRAAIDLYFFSASVTLAANNAAFTLSDADAALCVGSLQIASGNYATTMPGTPTNSNAFIPLWTTATSTGVAMPYVCAATTLFCAAVVQGTPTYAVGDLVFTFFVEQV